jgi:hypothetical protein
MKNRDNILWIFIHLHKTGGTTFNAHLKKYFKPNEEFFHLDSKDSQLKFNSLSKKEREKVKIIGGHDTYYGIHNKFPEKKAKYILFLRNPAERLVSQYNHHMSQIPEKEQVSFEKWYAGYPKNEMTLFLNQRFLGTGKKIQRSSFIQKMIGKKTNSKFWKKIRYFFKIYQSKFNSKKKFENAKKLLDKCELVGITENLNKDLKFLCKKIGIPSNFKNLRVSGKKSTWKSDIIGKEFKPAEKKFILNEKTREKINLENKLDIKLYNYARQLNRLSKK